MKGKKKGMAMGHIPILAHGTRVEQGQWKGPRVQTRPVHQAPLNATFKKPKSFAKA